MGHWNQRPTESQHNRGNLRASDDPMRQLEGDPLQQLEEDPELFLKIVSSAHEQYRAARKSGKDSKAMQEKLMALTAWLCRQVRSHKVPNRRGAYTHLLSICREAEAYDMGYRLWTWLRTQDDEYTDPVVYSAAMDMLRARGDSVESIEALYDEALKRFPGEFAEYHLSPLAIVPDRSQPTNIKGVSISLLRSMTETRLLHGDWKQAYTMLDVALRLYPTLTQPRFWQIFMLHRPVNEAYKICMMSCRAGIPPAPAALGNILNRLFMREDRQQPPVAVADLIGLVTSGLRLVVANGCAGGVMRHQSITMMIKLWTRVLRFQPPGGFAEDQLDHFRQAVEPIVESITSLCRFFLKMNPRPPLDLFNCLIVFGGLARRPDLVQRSLRDIESVNLVPNQHTRKSLMRAYGSLGDAEKLGAVWDEFVMSLEAEGQSPTRADWYVLVQAASDADQLAMVGAQLEAKAHTVSHEDSMMILRAVNETREGNSPVPAQQDANTPAEVPPQAPRAVSNAYLEDLSSQISTAHPMWRGLLHQLEYEARLYQTDDIPDFDEQDLPMDLDPRAGVARVGTPSASQELYHRLTSDPHQPQPEIEAAPESAGEPGMHELLRRPRTKTNIPLADLRYRNWANINELLATAGLFERAVVDSVPTPERPTPITYDMARDSGETGDIQRAKDRVWLSPGFVVPDYSQMDGEELTRTVLNLRGLDESQVPQLRPAARDFNK